MPIAYQFGPAIAVQFSPTSADSPALAHGLTLATNDVLVFLGNCADDAEAGTQIVAGAQGTNVWSRLQDGTRNAANQYGPSNRRAVEAWGTVIGAGQTGSVVFTFGHNVANWLSGVFVKITGHSIATPVGVVTASTPVGGGVTSHSVTAVIPNPQANMLILAALGLDLFQTSGGVANAAGYTNGVSVNNNLYPSFNASAKITSAVETSGATWSGFDSGGISQGAAALIIGIKEAASGGGGGGGSGGGSLVNGGLVQ